MLYRIPPYIMPAVSAYCVKCKEKKETKIVGVLVVGNRYSVKGTCPTCEAKQCVFVKKELGDEIGKEFKFLDAPSPASKEVLQKKIKNGSVEEKPKKTKKVKKEPEPEPEPESEQEEEEEEEKPKKKGKRKGEKVEKKVKKVEKTEKHEKRKKKHQ